MEGGTWVYKEKDLSLRISLIFDLLLLFSSHRLPTGFAYVAELARLGVAGIMPSLPGVFHRSPALGLFWSFLYFLFRRVTP